MSFARFSWLSRRTTVSGICAALVALSLSLVVFPRTASACDCALGEAIAPTAADKNVPTNTKIWTDIFGCDQAVLQKQGGMPVPTTIAQFGRITVIQPNADLEMGSTYELTNCASPTPRTTFTVTQGPDTTPPALPAFTLGETQASGGSFSSCGEELYVPLNVKHEGILLILDVAGRSTFDPKTFSGKPVDTFLGEDEPIVGDEICGSNNWDFDADGDAVNTKLGSFDLAGNFSGMSAPVEVAAGCTCTMAGSDVSHGREFVLAGLIFAGVLGRRRRR